MRFNTVVFLAFLLSIGTGLTLHCTGDPVDTGDDDDDNNDNDNNDDSAEDDDDDSADDDDDDSTGDDDDDSAEDDDDDSADDDDDDSTGDDDDDDNNDPPFLDENHEGWKNPGCWSDGCHTEDSTCEDSQGLFPWHCRSCHGSSNGAPVQDDPEHETEGCPDCHQDKLAKKHLPADQFTEDMACKACHSQ